VVGLAEVEEAFSAVVTIVTVKGRTAAAGTQRTPAPIKRTLRELIPARVGRTEEARKRPTDGEDDLPPTIRRVGLRTELTFPTQTTESENESSIIIYNIYIK
jgi:hypothetical protein